MPTFSLKSFDADEYAATKVRGSKAARVTKEIDEPATRAYCDRVRAVVEKMIKAGEPLSGLDLSGANLSGMDLRGQDFSGCSLFGATFVGADMRGATFTKAEMTHTNLRDSIVDKGAFDNATLVGTDMDSASEAP
jgi:uncharacterized protein YjbI with pentapeptide repeats